MTSIVSFLNSCFNSFAKNDLVEEGYSKFKFECEVGSISKVDFDLLRGIADHFFQGDYWRLELLIGGVRPISVSSGSLQVEKFISEIEQERQYLENERISLKLDISKDTSSGNISIYSFLDFEEFVGSIGTLQFLDIIREDLTANGSLEFKTLDDYDDFFYSQNISINTNRANEISMSKKIGQALLGKEYGFKNQEKYPYEPSCFRLLRKPSTRNQMSRKMEILEIAFSIIKIFDVTSLGEESLNYKLDGYKSISGNLNLNSDPLNSSEEYWKIYCWIYSGRGGALDKLGIARNILSIYLPDSSLEISENVYFSIQSAFKTYLQKNLDKYIELRSKLNEQLVLIIQKISSLTDEYTNGYQKSNFGFVSFFVSIFLVRVLSTGEFENVFTKDATILSFSFLIISFIYLCFSLWNLNEQMARVKARYKHLKSRFEDLLIKEDIQKILRDDKEFESEISFFKKRRWLVSILWILTIVIFFIAIVSLSPYSDWVLFWQTIDNADSL